MEKKTKGEFKIDKNIPIPAGKGNKDKGYSSTLRKLKVGESVLFPIKLNSVGGIAERILGRGGYVGRSVESGGVRIWRKK